MINPSGQSAAAIGGGNHFCELQAIDSILLPDVAQAVGLNRDAAFLLVHSGSRGLGFSVLERQLASGLVALDPGSPDGKSYMAAYDHAVVWAVANRKVIAQRAEEALRARASLICDIPHNFAEISPGGVLHRKGAAPSDRGIVPVPGSRGTLSYLVEPLGSMRSEALASLAHGAGRKYDRASMPGRVGGSKPEREKLGRNPFGGQVICEDRGLLVEEAPEAYKSIDRVIADLVEFGLARVVATFRPMVTMKKAAGSERASAVPWKNREDRR